MPRTARDQSATGIYHVMIRGINRQDIFEAPEESVLWQYSDGGQTRYDSKH